MPVGLGGTWSRGLDQAVPSYEAEADRTPAAICAGVGAAYRTRRTSHPEATILFPGNVSGKPLQDDGGPPGLVSKAQHETWKAKRPLSQNSVEPR
jgi:hypothetical protein